MAAAALDRVTVRHEGRQPILTTMMGPAQSSRTGTLATDRVDALSNTFRFLTIRGFFSGEVIQTDKPHFAF